MYSLLEDTKLNAERVNTSNTTKNTQHRDRAQNSPARSKPSTFAPVLNPQIA